MAKSRCEFLQFLVNLYGPPRFVQALHLFLQLFDEDPRVLPLLLEVALLILNQIEVRRSHQRGGDLVLHMEGGFVFQLLCFFGNVVNLIQKASVKTSF